MIARCPHCSARWRVPEDRIGPGGARIRCPACEGSFTWSPERPHPFSRGAGRPDPSVESVQGPNPDVDAWRDPEDGHSPRVASDDDEALRGVRPEVAARLAIEELSAGDARSLVEADAEGALFARGGPQLAAAFDRYRALAGRAASAATFRAALRERLGIELPGWEGES